LLEENETAAWIGTSLIGLSIYNPDTAAFTAPIGVLLLALFGFSRWYI
tara:strand:+ start:152 stop:295 length:144 start_codon:yes stop_codon:yes gene_type:complete